MPDNARKTWLHSQGVCILCKGVDAYTMAGRWLCAECAEKEAERQRNRRSENRAEVNRKQREYAKRKKEAGICRDCQNPIYNGTVFCKKHLFMQREYQKKYAEKKKPKKQPGMCLWCDTAAIEGKCFCESCLKRKRKILDNIRVSPREKHPWRQASFGKYGEISNTE